MVELGLFGALIEPEYGGLGLSAADLRPHRRADQRGVDEPHRRLQLPPDDGPGRPEVRHGGAEGTLAAQVRQRRAARRPGAHRARRRHRPAGDPHHRAARGRRLHRQRLEDLDHQRHRGPRRRPAGEDRPRSPAPPPGHEHADHAQARPGDRRALAGDHRRPASCPSSATAASTPASSASTTTPARRTCAWSAARRARAS